jgi:hypothetical protein
MNKLMIILVAFSTVSLMSGCVSEEQRLAKCEARELAVMFVITKKKNIGIITVLT